VIENLFGKTASIIIPGAQEEDGFQNFTSVAALLAVAIYRPNPPRPLASWPVREGF
jgi:hypothetical protein